MWAELSSFEFYIWRSCLGPSFGPWAELSLAKFYLGPVDMGRVGFGPSCPAPVVLV